MKIDLSKWELHPQENEQARKIELGFSFKEPALETLLLLPPKKRMKAKRKYFKTLRTQLLENVTFESYRWGGEKPSGRFIGTILMNHLPTIECIELDFLQNIFIEKIENATKRVAEEEEQQPCYFCVKMTVAIEVEGRKKGWQTVDKRYSLIKATSEEEAKKIAWDTKEEQEGEPYLNVYGRLVRWRVESIDDCYETYISSLEMPINYKSETIEVFSILKRRKLTKKRRWDGKF
jgi:hypothetical protein